MLEASRVPQQTPHVVQQPDNRPKYRGVSIPQSDAEWDILAKKDWKLAVDMRSHVQAQEIVRQNSQLTANNSVLEKSKERVIARHPELNDQSSEKTKIYLRILQENPQYLQDPKGPVHAMRDMEEYMEDVLGYTPEEIVKARKEGERRATDRQRRVDLSSSKGRTSLTGGNTVTLSKDELEFCKYHNIDPKEYARNKKKVGGSKADRGIQV
jgi:hypothetical protein